MTILSTIPEIVDVDHYAGDTLTMHITVDTAVVAGRVFTAQVRASRTATKIDAVFEVIPTTPGADIQLTSEDSRRLTKRGDYTGWWDVQLAMPDGADPVLTLAHGELRLHSDVTKVGS